MAVFSWICDLQGRALRDCLQPIVAELDLWLDDEFCSDRQLYAVDRPDGSIPTGAWVKLLASWSCSQGRACQLEAERLHLLLPPLVAA
jgi:hypothetical protein